MLYENRPQKDKDFITKVCNFILSQNNTEKQDSNIFCGIYIEGRDREINTLEDITALHSFKVFSKFNYPIYYFINNDSNFIEEIEYEGYIKNGCRIEIIKIPPINSLDEYTNFCVKDLYNFIPKDYKYVVHLQPDAMLLKSGWEEVILNKNWAYIGSPWQHSPAIEYQDNNGNWRDFMNPVRVGNGGFSIRRLDFCRAASNCYKDLRIREKYAPNNKIPPEDLFFSVLAYPDVPTIQEANKFCCDPLTPEIFNSSNIPFGFHYFKSI